MYKNKTIRGFTLIELLVVITIIGILSSVVINFLNAARAGSSDATIKNSLASMRAEGENWYDVNDIGFRSICAETRMNELFQAAKNASGGSSGVCWSTTVAWAAWVPLKSSVGGAQVWCVDSIGSSKQIPRPGGAGRITAC